MLLHRGAQFPRNKSVVTSAGLAGRCYIVFLLIGSTVLLPAEAQAQPSLTLAEAEALALHEEPGQSALLASADAMRERAVVAGELPDPELRMGLANYPIESGGFTTEGMTQAMLGIRQSFPPGKTRAFRTQQFRSMADEMSQTATAREREVLTLVRNAWLEAYYWERAHTIVSESRPYFEDLVTVTQSLYAVGKKDQQDVLRADLELSRLNDRLIDISRQRANSRAALSEWIGADSGRPIAETLPSWNSVPPLASLQVELARHPALQAADARVDARVAGIDIAREQVKPGWALDLGYGYRNGYLPSGDPRSDFVSLSVTMDLPLFRKNRQNRELAAALSERRAAADSREEVRRRLASQLHAAYTQWQELSRRVDLYERLILVQAEDQANAALAAYQSETGDFADVMRGFIDNLTTRLDHIRLQTERAQSYAVLANLGGIPR
ncbi:MAG: TolC family protein [Gammaproteobacteria bacterium]|nr:TolC family protein [Gammaproteobacteria bacterium]